MLINILIGLLGIAGTVSIQGYGTTFISNYVYNKYFLLDTNKFLKKRVRLLISVAFILLLLHFFEAIVWALIYYFDPSITEFETFEKALYFSMVTFTTLGYGDITISSTSARLLSGFEAVNGVILLGWSTTIMFSIVQEIMQRLELKGSNKSEKA